MYGDAIKSPTIRIFFLSAFHQYLSKLIVSATSYVDLGHDSQKSAVPSYDTTRYSYCTFAFSHRPQSSFCFSSVACIEEE
jgi:hypothetical protein